MTGRKNADREAFDQLVDFLVEDVLDASDEDMLAEAREAGIDPDADAVRLRALFERTGIEGNKRRLVAAKAAVQAGRNIRPSVNTVFDIDEARRKLRAVIEQRGISEQLTMAARNESELPDEDVLSLVQDFEELGVLPREQK